MKTLLEGVIHANTPYEDIDDYTRLFDYLQIKVKGQLQTFTDVIYEVLKQNYKHDDLITVDLNNKRVLHIELHMDGYADYISVMDRVVDHIIPDLEYEILELLRSKKKSRMKIPFKMVMHSDNNSVQPYKANAVSTSLWSKITKEL